MSRLDSSQSLTTSQPDNLIAERILRIMRRLVAIDEVSSFAVPHGDAPILLSSASKLGSTKTRTSLYAQEFYRSDPLWSQQRLREKSRLSRHVLSAEDIGRSDYREICFDRPRLRQKVCFKHVSGDNLVLCNFYLCTPVDTKKLQDLEEVAALAIPALAQLAESRIARSQSIVSRIEARLATRYEKLTLRERQVCARSVAGWNSQEIAEDLSIGPGSVLTYRRRAYARYGFSSSGQFLDQIMG